MTLNELMDHFCKLYGRRNRIFLPSLRDRIDFLNLAIGDLQDAVRKKHDQGTLGVALSRIVSRILCIAEHFSTVPLVEMMVKKYPIDRCSYCGTKPCTCPERRPAPRLATPTTFIQEDWGLTEWCQHLEALYGTKNRRRGIENLVNRLFKEISELLSLQMNTARSQKSIYEIEDEFALELADALAWTIAIANCLEVDLNEAVIDRYGSGCWNCHQNPCLCTHFNVEPVRWR